MLQNLITFRPSKSDDYAFIRDSWSKSFRDSPWAGCVPNNLYVETLNNAVDQLALRGARVLVAAAKHDENKILGWVCYEQKPGTAICHYIYVKDPYRQKGLATALLERISAKDDACFYTFRTNASRYLGARWVHAPEIARRHQA